MATKSIFKPVVIENEQQCEDLLNAIEKSKQNAGKNKSSFNVKYADDKAIIEFFNHQGKN